MSDKIKKYLALDKKVLITVIESTELVEEARKIHDLTPTTTAAVGRLLTAVALMGVELKNEGDSISAQINIELPLNEQGKIDVGGAVGKQGYLNIIKDIGLKEPYIGIVPLTSGEIAEDFARYFVESEQKNSAVSLGVLVNKEGVLRAGGYSIALMPDATNEIATKLEENIKNMPSISKMLDKNANLDEIAQQITGDSKLETI